LGADRAARQTTLITTPAGTGPKGHSRICAGHAAGPSRCGPAIVEALAAGTDVEEAIVAAAAEGADVPGLFLTSLPPSGRRMD